MQSNKNKSKYQNFLTLKTLFELLNLIEYNSMTCKIHYFNTLYAYFLLCICTAFFISFFENFTAFFECKNTYFDVFVSFSNLLC